jgi:carbonic anhydrase
MADTEMAAKQEMASSTPAVMPKPAPPMGPPSMADLPWKRLLEGNKRFVSGKVTHPDQSMARIEEVSKEQKPFAIVLACSDSPAPPEVVFDQGLGDLIVIRTAGEVASDVELGSIEYAVDHLGVPYLVVMGHRDCSIVDETLKGGDLPANIEAVAAQIRPAVEAARFMKGDLLDNTVRENTKNMVKKIQDTPALAMAISEGRLNVKAAYYDSMTGKVSDLP